MRNKSGFSMLEVLIVIVIMALMMGFGVPYILGWLPHYRARNAARDIHSNMQIARMAAIKEHRPCTVTFDSDGYKVYFDDPSNHNNVYDAGSDQLLKAVNLAEEYKGDVIPDGMTLPDNSVTFLSNGLIESTLGSVSRTVAVATAERDRRWVLSISPTGGVRITPPDE